jgi:hypothetical protein
MKDNDSLHERLRGWKFEPAIPRRFQAEVWSRIKAREQEHTDTGWAGFIRWLFPSPVVWQLATATAVVMLVLGASLGTLKANAANEVSRSALAQRYAQTVDPYLLLARHGR